MDRHPAMFAVVVIAHLQSVGEGDYSMSCAPQRWWEPDFR